MFSEVDITLNIRNNRSYTQTVNVMGNPYNLLDTSNAKTEYRWNLTTFVFTTETSITLEYKQVNELSYSVYTSNLNAQNIQSVVSALNNLGIGYFNTYTELGQTYISTNNDNYVFGSLNIGNTSIINQNFNSNLGFTTLYPIASVIQADDKILCVGLFTAYNGNPYNRIIRLNTDGSVDLSFNIGSGFNNSAFDIALQQDGKILVVGGFTTYNGTSANGIVRLNTDGTIDPSFNYGTGFVITSIVYSLAIQSDGKILVSGGFTSYNGTPANNIIRLNSDGSVDLTFVYGLGFNSDVSNIILQSDNKIIAIGTFNSYNGNGCNYIARINTDGTFDNTFITGIGFSLSVGLPTGIAILPTNVIVLVGFISNYNNTAINNILFLNSDGSINTSTTTAGLGFNLGGSRSVAIYNNKIYIIGVFNSYNGNPCSGIVSLNYDATINNVNFGSGFILGSPIGISIGLNGASYITGSFNTFDGTTADGIVSLSL